MNARQKTLTIKFPYQVKQIDANVITIEVPVAHSNEIFTDEVMQLTEKCIGKRDTVRLFDELTQQYNQLLLQRSLIIS